MTHSKSRASWSAKTLLEELLGFPKRVRAAGGDVIEALHGHRCGPNCWHAIGDTPEERRAWWEKKQYRSDGVLSKRSGYRGN